MDQAGLFRDPDFAHDSGSGRGSAGGDVTYVRLEVAV